MNFFTFLLTRQLVANKTGDTGRADQLALASSLIPGSYGMLMGVLLANNEPAPPPPNPKGGNGGTPLAIERPTPHKHS